MKKVINQYMSVSSAENDVGEIHIYGDIVDTKWWDEDVTPKEIRDALENCKGVKTLEVHVNSNGGSVPAGNGIISIIDSFKLKNKCVVESYIEGMCASMASGIVMAADKIYMAANAMLLLHKPLMSTYGNADDFQENIDFLNKAEDCLVKNYMRHWNRSEAELREALAKTSIYTAEEALELGLCDEIISGVEIAASANGIRINGNMFDKHVADLMKNKYPNVDLKKKEDKALTYDNKLKDFGISEDDFAAFNMESDKVMAIAKVVKEKTTVEPFMDKANVCEALGCENITAEEVLNYAKAGMNPPASEPDNETVNKATAYDKIVDKAREKAQSNAVRALGNFYNEARVKKMLAALDYDDIIEQSESWNKQAQEELHAGKRVSVNEASYENNGGSKIKNDDYKF